MEEKEERQIQDILYISAEIQSSLRNDTEILKIIIYHAECVKGQSNFP